MANLLKKHLHPLGSRIIFWNIALLVFIKLVLPQSAFQLAAILESVPVFDSREIVTLTNNIRSQNNLNPLTPNFQLDLAASEKLKDMISNSYFAHISPNEVTPWFWIRKSDYQYSIAGENLAVGFFTAEDAVKAWLDSPSHKDNLLGNDYRDIGVAVGKGKVGGIDGIIVVQIFGKQKTIAQAGTTALKPTKPSVPTPSPITSLTPSAIPSSTVATLGESEALETPEKQTATLLQYPSTDKDAKPIAKPIVATPARNWNMSKTIQNVNTGFSLYSFAFAVMSLLALLLSNRDKMAAFKTVGHVGIFLLSMAIVSANITIGALIF